MSTLRCLICGEEYEYEELIECICFKCLETLSALKKNKERVAKRHKDYWYGKHP